MNKYLAITLALILLLTVGITTVMAEGDDPFPGVEYNPWDVDYSVPAGDWGWFYTYDWWWATYSNGTSHLKCLTHLDPWQEPPSEVVIAWEGPCGTPGGTTNGYTKVYPDGHVALLCKVKS